MENKDGGKYEDIINLQHHTSSRHPRMARRDRAAQFSPFAALTGYYDVIRETARYTDVKVELSECELEEINAKLRELLERITEQTQVSIAYFKADSKKAGGEYLTVSGRLKKMDVYDRSIVLDNGEVIFMEDIFSIETAENL